MCRPCEAGVVARSAKQRNMQAQRKYGCAKVCHCEEPRLWATRQSPASAQKMGLAMAQNGMSGDFAATLPAQRSCRMSPNTREQVQLNGIAMPDIE